MYEQSEFVQIVLSEGDRGSIVHVRLSLTGVFSPECVYRWVEPLVARGCLSAHAFTSTFFGRLRCTAYYVSTEYFSQAVVPDLDSRGSERGAYMGGGGNN